MSAAVGTRLTDLAREMGDWPIDIVKVADLLDAADFLLPEGRWCNRVLTEEEIIMLRDVVDDLGGGE